ncbi:hypothetical protein Kpol_431p5 [Vanderwaltozyma polyspora DSM 70294]|uniref:Uncharacterized protein n=1 Tax=Vanderwaltozyma polyspora (strain ATCC 22028 / DSM 70294 / BCRC 21397 / CBS 2163 / NBRC 10782 / NRRL Y-8283 / UCD 57-17) TaxID=436907 RepID=A7TRM6_VANPO|nr:uncharacterized protein Kpol_431p5 [Vanderwaltozyma polyspora DSM 70294]EDO15078.1 hypothetical protein Kpol_431p5 [Vanderwaltozyma polyspora DSM 70294]
MANLITHAETERWELSLPLSLSFSFRNNTGVLCSALLCSALRCSALPHTANDLFLLLPPRSRISSLALALSLSLSLFTPSTKKTHSYAKTRASVHRPSTNAQFAFAFAFASVFSRFSRRPPFKVTLSVLAHLTTISHFLFHLQFRISNFEFRINKLSYTLPSRALLSLLGNSHLIQSPLTVSESSSSSSSNSESRQQKRLYSSSLPFPSLLQWVSGKWFRYTVILQL